MTLKKVSHAFVLAGFEHMTSIMGRTLFVRQISNLPNRFLFSTIRK